MGEAFRAQGIDFHQEFLMIKLEETIIEIAQNELQTIKSFVGKTKFSMEERQSLIDAFLSSGAFTQLALMSDSGMSEDACVIMREIESDRARTFGSIDASASDNDSHNAAMEAIKFSLSDAKGQAFLRYWVSGDFDAIRNEWPKAPEGVFIGADYFHVPSN